MARSHISPSPDLDLISPVVRTVPRELAWREYLSFFIPVPLSCQTDHSKLAEVLRGFRELTPMVEWEIIGIGKTSESLEFYKTALDWLSLIALSHSLERASVFLFDGKVKVYFELQEHWEIPYVTPSSRLRIYPCRERSRAGWTICDVKNFESFKVGQA